MTCGRLYSYETLLQRLTQDLQDVAAALRQFIQQEHAVVRLGYVARQRHLAAADQAQPAKPRRKGRRGPFTGRHAGGTLTR
jgi:hypothetical protein